MESKRVLCYTDKRFPSTLRERLQSRNYLIETAADAKALLEQITQGRPDAVIAFARMDGGDGLSLCKQVKEDPALRATPVLILAAKKGEDRQAYYAAGCDGLFEAPFDDVGITRRLDDLVLDRSSARRLSLARLAIDYKVNSDVLTVSPQELHGGTVFLHARNPLDQGSRLKLTLNMAGKTLIDAYGEVVRSEPYRGFSSQPSGMAIHLYDLDEESRRFLEGLTRQRLVSGRTWEGVHVETLVDKILDEVGSGAAAGPQDQLLARAGYYARLLRPWEKAAFEVSEDGEAELEAGALREAVGVLYKLNYHLAEYREFAYLAAPALKRLTFHSEQTLARAQATADVLLSIAESAQRGGRRQRHDELSETQTEILNKMVEVRTAIADAQRNAREAAPTITEDMLGVDDQLRQLSRGLADLFDFRSSYDKKVHARLLNPELDLAEMSAFEVRCFMDDPGAASAAHPDICTWTRVLVARHLQIAEFLRYRRPGREIRKDRVEEVVEVSQQAISGLLACQDLFRGDLRRLGARPRSPREHLAELSASNHRALEAAARLCAYYLQHAPAGSPDYRKELIAAASGAAAVVPPAGNPGPLSFPAAAARTSASWTAPARPTQSTQPAAAPRLPLLERLGPVGGFLRAVGPKRFFLVLAALGVVGAGVFAWKLLRPGDPIRPAAIDVGFLRGIISVKRCELRVAWLKDQRKLRTIHCVVDDTWARQPEEKRRAELETLGEAVLRKLRVNRVLLEDAKQYTLGYAEGKQVELYDR